MNPFIGGALIGAGANLIGNIFGKKSNDNANTTNMKIAQMNNEWSEKMMQKQMDYNTDMWNKQNAYNDPSKQVERLKAAGINPALALQNVSTGTAQSGNSVGLPSPSSPSVQPYKYDFSGIGNALMSAISIDNQNKVQESQSRLTNMQADFYGAKTMAEIAKMYAETNSHTAKTFYQNLMNKYGDAMLGEQYRNQLRQNEHLEVQILNTVRQGLLLDKDIATYDARTNGMLSEQLSRIALNYANGSLSLRQADESFERTLNLTEQRIGMKIDNDIKANLRDSTIERGKQAQNMYQWTDDVGKRIRSDMDKFGDSASRWFNNYIVKPTKRAWKDTRRSFGLYFD